MAGAVGFFPIVIFKTDMGLVPDLAITYFAGIAITAFISWGIKKSFMREYVPRQDYNKLIGEYNKISDEYNSLLKEFQEAVDEMKEIQALLKAAKKE